MVKLQVSVADKKLQIGIALIRVERGGHRAERHTDGIALSAGERQTQGFGDVAGFFHTDIKSAASRNARLKKSVDGCFCRNGRVREPDINGGQWQSGDGIHHDALQARCTAVGWLQHKQSTFNITQNKRTVRKIRVGASNAIKSGTGKIVSIVITDHHHIIRNGCVKNSHSVGVMRHHQIVVPHMNVVRNGGFRW